MKLRAIKRRAYKYQISGRCKAYNMWCPQCLKNRFYELNGRYPYDYQEYMRETVMKNLTLFDKSPYYGSLTNDKHHTLTYISPKTAGLEKSHKTSTDSYPST